MKLYPVWGLADSFPLDLMERSPEQLHVFMPSWGLTALRPQVLHSEFNYLINCSIIFYLKFKSIKMTYLTFY